MSKQYETTVPYAKAMLENVKLRYKVLDNNTFEVEEFSLNGRDLRFLFNPKVLEDLATADYVKTEQVKKPRKKKEIIIK